jgi:hypothetical protein
MYGTNLLADDGQELVMWRYSKPLWSAKALGYGADFSLFESGTASASTTVFRTWVSDLDEPDANPGSLFAGMTWPLTEQAGQAAATFNPVTDTTTEGCTPKGMPAIIRQPFPIEFVDRGDAIELRMEEYDTLRTIHMDASSSADVPRTPLGYSVGTWEATRSSSRRRGSASRTSITRVRRWGRPRSSSSGSPRARTAVG